MLSEVEWIDDIDSVRGIAILLVLFWHGKFLVEDYTYLPVFLKSFVNAGHTGVTIFFILSAFLLTQPYIKSVKTGIVPSWKKFYIRRILRIIPLYFFMVFLSAIVLGNYQTALKALNIFWGVNGPELHPFSNSWWALYTEIQFYILLPFVGSLLICNKKKMYLVFLLIFYLVLYVVFFMKTKHVISIDLFLRLIFSFLGRGYIFIIGALSAWGYIFYGAKIRAWSSRNFFMSKGGGDFIFILCILLLRWLMVINAKITYWKIETDYPIWHIFESLLWSAFILGLLLLPLKTKPFFSNFVLKSIGKISYSIFLLHIPIIIYGAYAISEFCKITKTPTPSSGWVIIVIFAFSLLISAFSYKLIEKPFLEKKNKFY